MWYNMSQVRDGARTVTRPLDMEWLSCDTTTVISSPATSDK